MFDILEQGCVLSPKESQERQQRIITLRKIDKEIDQIMSINSKHNSQYKEFIDKVLFIEEHYKRQNQHLQTCLSTMNQKYSSLQSMYLSLKEQLQSAYVQTQQSKKESLKYKNQISKLKIMIKNQQELIDEYKKNIEEEILLEKEFLKSEFNEDKIKLQFQFNRVINQMEKQYQDKIKKVTRELQVKDFKHEHKELKRLVSSKNLQEKQLTRINSKAKGINSQYSTNDQENRHNQPVFFI